MSPTFLDSTHGCNGSQGFSCGDNKDLSYWRGNCLNDLAYKLLSSIISVCLLKHLKVVGLKHQNGSTLEHGCIDAQYCLCTTLHLHKQHGLDTWALFVDLIEAFETAYHKLLFKILEKYGVPARSIDTIRRLYKDSKVIIKIGKELREFIYGIGVKQGVNMAPVLFVFLINAFAETLKKN